MAKAPKHSRRTQTGIELSREVKLKTEWPKFLSNMIKVAVSGFAAANGALEKVGDAGESLLEAGAAVKVDSPPGERGWTLFCLGFAWAFDELRISNQLDDIGIEAAVREALEKASLLVDQGGQVIPVSFLDRPTTLPLYTIVRDAFIERKGTFRPAGGEADEILRARFDAAFDRAIFLLWSQAPEIYQPLATALSVPAAKAHAYRLEWDSYRKSLIHLFEVKPVFGQEESKISLSQLYVQLRGVWREEPNETRNATGGKKPAKTVPEIGHLVQLDAELDHWATGGEDGYQLALIGGGPGSGKSTTVKALASRLAARENCRPLYVPLLHINPTRDLLAEINRYFTQGTDNPFRQPPLERSAVESGPPLVLIFDGLDEQAVTGKASDDLVRDFMIQLAQLAFSLKGERKGRLRTIVTGRMPSFQAAQRYATNLWRAYEVLGFLPLTNPVVQKLFTNVDSEEQQEIAKVDQRRRAKTSESRRCGERLLR